jgi:hypothetical protein
MSNTIRFGIAAAVVVVAAIIGFTYINSQVGSDEPSPAPSPSANLGGALPDGLRHPFLGERRDVPGRPSTAAILVFGASTFEFFDGTTTSMRSSAAAMGSGQLQVVSVEGTAGCEIGDEGRYAYTLSPGGSLMTITLGSDPCPARAAAMVGEFQRSDCRNADNFCLGNLEAGSYSSQYVEPRPAGEWEARFGALTYTVPEGWAASADFPELYQLMTQSEYATDEGDCGDCDASINVWVNPLPAAPNCSENSAAGYGTSAADLRTWIADQPGLVSGPQHDVTIGSLSAFYFDIELAPGWTATCGDPANPFIGAPIFFNGYHLAIGVGDRQRFVLLDLGDGNTVAINIDPRDATSFDAFVAEAMPIVETFEFPAP